jgi:hypothetical protein
MGGANSHRAGPHHTESVLFPQSSCSKAAANAAPGTTTARKPSRRAGNSRDCPEGWTWNEPIVTLRLPDGAPTARISRWCPNVTLGASSASARCLSSVSVLANNSAAIAVESALRKRLRLARLRLTMPRIAPSKTTFDSSRTLAPRTSDGAVFVAPPALSRAASSAVFPKSLPLNNAAVAGAGTRNDESTAPQILSPVVVSGKGKGKRKVGSLESSANLRRQNSPELVGAVPPAPAARPNNWDTRAATVRKACEAVWTRAQGNLPLGHAARRPPAPATQAGLRRKIVHGACGARRSQVERPHPAGVAPLLLRASSVVPLTAARPRQTRWQPSRPPCRAARERGSWREGAAGGRTKCPLLNVRSTGVRHVDTGTVLP